MKSRIVTIFLSILVPLTLGFKPLLAQQGSPQTSGGPQQGSQAASPYIGPQPYGPIPQISPQGQTYYSPTPYIGAQPYSPLPQMSPQLQSPYRPDLMVPSQGSPRFPLPQGDLSQVNRRHCALVSPGLLPSQPSRPTIPGPSRTVPVQGLWPGSPEMGGIFEAGNLRRSDQFKSIQAPFAQSGQTSPADSRRQLDGRSSYVAGEASPGQFFDEPLSTIEATFQQVPNFTADARKELRQYGYSLFSSPISTFAPVEDVPVGPDYILGPGDDLAINIWGTMEGAVLRTVDRNGQIFLPSVGPVRIWGLAFSQAERLIREQLSRYYRGFQTSVTMGRLRTMKVYVVGEVCQPGAFTLSSLSTVTNALFAAGGPAKLGSLRNIQLKRNHHDLGTIDFYDFLLRGDKTRDFRLESGDTIFVPPIGPSIGIEGEVKRPAIYELRGPTRISDLIEMAGGLTPQSYLKRVQVIRAKPNAEREAIDLDLTDLRGNGHSESNVEVRDGDLVRIYPTDPRIYNTIRIAGAVKYPGEYELKRGMRLSGLLRREVVLPEGYLEKVDIARVKDDLTTEVVQVDLREAWEGDQSQDLVLRPRDFITVRSEYRLAWSITLSGEVKRPGVYTIKPGERLSFILKRAGGFTHKAFLKGAVFTRETVRRVESEQLRNFLQTQEERFLAQASRVNVAGGAGTESAQSRDILDAQLGLLRSLTSRVAVGRVVMKLDEPGQLDGSPSDIVLEDGDRLFVPSVPSSVAILGAVRSPTSVLHKEEEGVEFYLNRAGGLTKQADEREVYIVKADGSAIAGFTRLRKIEPGDAVIVPPKEEERYRWMGITRDWITILGQTMLTLAALASLL